MNYKAPLAVVLTGLALVIGTVVTVANGHDGTPAVTVLVSRSPAAIPSALPLSAPEGPCASVPHGPAGQGGSDGLLGLLGHGLGLSSVW